MVRPKMENKYNGEKKERERESEWKKKEVHQVAYIKYKSENKHLSRFSVCAS